MSRDELNDEIQKYFEEGGEVTRLKYADKRIQEKACRKFYHLSKTHDSDRSRQYLEKEEEKESRLVFSKEDRMKE
jgi:hypothetical protein